MSSRNTRRQSRAAFDPGTIRDLYDYATQPAPTLGRPVKHDLAGWRVVDDWPARVPITDREVDVFEAWFGAILDDLFGPV